ncbi:MULTISPECIES: hypothetical protein [unclassified Nocardiopsis]|uniref:hypothetical protein n=1 Tax=Nocardiopsis TaxID=2013 RepID=UPI00387ACA88
MTAHARSTRNGGPAAPPRPTFRDRAAGAAVAVGAVVFAASGLLPGGESGTGTYLLVNLVVVGAMALVLFGLPVLRLRYRESLGRPGAWGSGLTAAGLVATMAGCLTNIVAGSLTGQAQGVVAAVGIPAWILAHLVYVGATVLGLACLRVSAVPRPVAAALIGGLPVLVIGVLCGLTLDGTAATVVTWASTEGQVGLAWLLAGGFLLAGRRDGAESGPRG